MNLDYYQKEAYKMVAIAELDRDAVMVAGFSRQDDKFECIMSDTMDAGDALLVIRGLIEAFGLDPEVIGSMHTSVSRTGQPETQPALLLTAETQTAPDTTPPGIEAPLVR